MVTELRFIDLGHTIEDGLVTYPGLPPPRVRTHLSREASREHYAPGTSFAIASIELVANTGTYVDAPFHRYHEGKDLAELPLSSLAHVPGICVNTRERAIGAEALHGFELEGKAVLVRTGWSRHFGTDAYLTDYPFLTREAAELLVAARARLVGIDSPNVDDRTDPRRPVHTTLLGAEIPIVEHLRGLDALHDRPFRFFAVPPRIRGLTSFPVRAFAMVSA